MFTGLVSRGSVQAIRHLQEAARITIASQFSQLQLGESIAVNGVCLTVVEIAGNQFACDVSSETLTVTNLHNLQVGDVLNLERALTLQDRLGGHLVTGHVDGVLQITTLRRENNYHVLEVAGIPDACRCYVVKKGCITINGISLTINDIVDDRISFMLIPHTWQETNLSTCKMGDWVNVEYDYVAKVVKQQAEVYL